MSSQDTASVPAKPKPQFLAPSMTNKQIMLVMVGLLLGMFLAVLDQTVVGTALYTIVRDLDPRNGLAHLSWVITAYLLTSTATQPLYGKMSDLYGRKKIFTLAIVLFLIGSALCGLSQNLTQLIIFRAVQGLGAGGLMTLAMAIIGDMIAPRERGKYTGMFGIVFGVGSVLGPLVGGFLTDPHPFLGLTTDWRWVFYINVPIGLLALVVIEKVLHLPKNIQKHAIDYMGAAYIVIAATSLLLLTEWGGQQYAWISPIILALGAAVALFTGLFIRHEMKVPEPILNMHLFKNGVFNVATPVLFIMGAALFGSLVYVSLYFQVVNGLSPTEAGLHLVPMSLGMIPVSIVVGRIISKTGRYKIFPIIGMALITVAMVMLGRLTVTTPSWAISADLFLLGMGMGMVMQVITMAVQNAIPRNEMGAGTAATGFFRSLGGAIGSAAFGALLTSQLTHHLAQAAAATGGAKVSIQNSGAIHQLPASAQHVIFEAFTKSTNVVFLTAAVLTFIGFIFTLFLPEMRLRSHQDDKNMEVSGHSQSTEAV
ncbi:MAG TPA: MDR family MFS transporter [Candidatus Saccharimonadales bacterium]|nr:MDR family MFS transporter [Candidatus Saccharimonadales bacterium]